MNCREFAEFVHELARASDGAAGVCSEALAHARSCDHCSERLGDARALAAGLAALAAETVEAPPIQELNLRRAYREALASHAPGVESVAGRRNPFWKPATAAAAAVMVLLATYYAIHLPRPVLQEPSGVARQAPSAEEPPTSRGAQTATPRAGEVRHRDGSLAAAPVRSRARIKPAGRVIKAAGSVPDAAGTATDFLPVTYVGNLRDFESLQVVRTRVPRTTMISFGLPISQERADAPVTADMLISPDGVVRAIRFVR